MEVPLEEPPSVPGISKVKEGTNSPFQVSAIPFNCMITVLIYVVHSNRAVEFESQNFLPATGIYPCQFTTVQEHQSFSSSLVMNQPAAPYIVWSKDMSSVSCLGTTLSLANLRSGLNKIFMDIKSHITKLTGGVDINISIPDDLVDDFTNHTFGHSWLSCGTFTAKQYPLLEILMHHPTYKIGGTRGNTFHWNFGGLHTVRKDIAEINKLLAVLCFVLPAPPPRGTEFADTCLQNSDIPRNYDPSGTKVSFL